MRRRILVVVTALLLAATAGGGAAVAPATAQAECLGFSVNSDDRVTHPGLDEASGLVASRLLADVYWTHNDGDPAKSPAENNRIYAIDGGGNLLATVQFVMSGSVSTVPGPQFVELEDIAIGWGPDRNRDYLYLGDIGDNDGERDHVRIYRFAEPQFAPNPGQPIPITVHESKLEVTVARYQSYRNPSELHARNSEAMFVDPLTGDLFLVEKAEHFLTEIGFPNGGNQERVWSIVYRIPRSRLFVGGTKTAKIATYVRAQYDTSTIGITGGDISADGRIVAMKNRDQTFYWFRKHNDTVVDLFDEAHTAMCVMNENVPGEALAILPDGSAFYYVREGTLSPVYRATIDGWAGPECQGLTATIVGGPGPDTLRGTPGDDVIVGLGGADTIDGGAGHDRICGGAGDDVIDGGDGRDVIFGGLGQDDLSGGKGKDKLWGDFDKDVLHGDSGADVLRGGEHRDRVHGGPGLDTVHGGKGSDRVNGNGATDVLKGGNGSDILRGNGGDDDLVGGGGSDECDGGSGIDTASGNCETVIDVP